MKEEYTNVLAFDITLDKIVSSDKELTDILDKEQVTETHKPLVIKFSAPELPENKVIINYTNNF